MNTFVLTTVLVLFYVASTVPSPSARVIGGHPATPGQFPSTVAIKMVPLSKYYCSGTIIDKSWVLTAAQCLVNTAAQPPDINILAGTNDLRTAGTTYNISKIIVHPQYNATNLFNDVALLKIVGEFELSETVQIAEIGEIGVNKSCVVAGWGQTEITNVPAVMFYADVRTLNDEECDKLSEDGLFFMERGLGQICAFGGNGVGVCDGDGGDPLMVGGKFVGMASYSVQPCASWWPDVYTKVAVYVDWINESINL